ncbi:hypothetical protein Droror1_Dr00026616 [Drosera rotundifolia]
MSYHWGKLRSGFGVRSWWFLMDQGSGFSWTGLKHPDVRSSGTRLVKLDNEVVGVENVKVVGWFVVWQLGACGFNIVDESLVGFVELMLELVVEFGVRNC